MNNVYEITFHIKYEDGTCSKPMTSKAKYYGNSPAEAWNDFLSSRGHYSKDEAAKRFVLDDFRIVS